MKQLLIATRSKGKFPEIIAELQGAPFEFLNMRDVQAIPENFEVEEPAMTFEGNAIIKAMTVGIKAGVITLAEDSGLEVDALGGRPGVYTARYAPGTDKDRYQKLLAELEGVPLEKRTARFRAAVAIFDPATLKIRTGEAVYEGRIALEPKGNNGFGYDPVFYNDALQKTGAEMSLEEKNRVSHRGQVMRKATQILLDEFA